MNKVDCELTHENLLETLKTEFTNFVHDVSKKLNTFLTSSSVSSSMFFLAKSVIISKRVYVFLHY